MPSETTPTPPSTPPSTTPTPTPSPTSSTPPPTSPPPGLLNLGNTCYFNSVVQILYHVIPFRRALLALPLDAPTEHHSFACHVTFALKTLFLTLDDAAAKAGAVVPTYPAPMQNTRNITPSSTGDVRDQRDSSNVHGRVETQESGFGYGKEKDEDDFAYEDEDDFLDDDGEIIESDNQLREGYEYVMPEAMINLLRDVERTDFEARGQQDAHEFLRFLLDKVNDCLHETAKHSVVAATELRVALERVCCESNTRTASAIAMPVDAAASDGSRVVSPAAKRRRCEYTEDDVYAPVPPPSPLTEMGFLHSRRDGRGTGRIKKRYRRHLVCDLFQGRAVTATRCMECECRTERAENFLDVSLPVAVGKTLSWAWSAQGARENMKGDNKYHCENCATYTEAERWWQISELPDVLTVHLKLFAFESPFMGNGGKVPVAMPCPLSMKLSEWCSGDCADRDEEYKLTGIIVHEGTGASSGHYYSYIYKGDKESWFVFDDASVTPVAEAEMKDRLFTSARTRRTAYLLFYTHHARIY